MDRNTIKNAFDTINLSTETENKVLENLLKQSRKDGIVMKKTNRKKPITVIAAAAAAAVFTVSAGAAVYTQFIHKDSVTQYMNEGGADKLESMEMASNAVSQNEHFKATADMFLSDGRNIIAIFTLEALDDIGHEILDGSGAYAPYIEPYYADTGEKINNSGSGSMVRDQSSAFMYHAKINDIDTSRDVRYVFYYNFLNAPQDHEEEHEDATIIPENLMGGIEFTFNVQKNVETVMLADDNGNEMTMSPFSLSCDHTLITDISSGVAGGDVEADMIRLISTDGSYKSFSDNSCWLTSNGDENNDGFFAYFGDIIELDDYVGVEINGVEYLKQ